MGKLAPTGIDLSPTVVSASFTATGQSASANFYGPFNVALWGTFVGTVQLQRSFDGGVTWLPASFDGQGDIASYTVPTSFVVNEPEHGVLYRLNCTAFTSGAINYRISAGGDFYSVGGVSR
jgi:hypothetical protein